MKHTPDTIALSAWHKDVWSVLVFQCLLLISLVLVAAIFFSYLSAANILFSGLSIFVPSLILGVWWRYKILRGNFSSNMMLIALFLKTILSGICLVGSLFILKDFHWVWQGFFIGLISMVLSPTLCGLWYGFSK
ncbi:MAG: hypothetical protein RI956_485 [Pseudomonadota bacterium]|jgi:hypothetical protein